jgi:hypothetical protein
MGLQIRPLWDPTGSVSVEVDEARRELVVTANGGRTQFVLRERQPGRLGWVEQAPGRRGARNVPVSVGDVVCHCLREWDAEQAVLALSERAAARATARGGQWEAAGRRVAGQVRAAPRRRRVSTLPFRVLLEHRSGGAEAGAPTVARAAERAAYLTATGRSDTQRLRRRSGLAQHRDGHRDQPGWQRSVRYETGLALCRAVELDPVELGL